MIDIVAAREAYNANENLNVEIVRSEHTAADGHTKPKFYGALDSKLRTGMDTNPVLQWIIRIATRSHFQGGGNVEVWAAIQLCSEYVTTVLLLYWV